MIFLYLEVSYYILCYLYLNKDYFEDLFTIAKLTETNIINAKKIELIIIILTLRRARKHFAHKVTSSQINESEYVLC